MLKKILLAFLAMVMMIASGSSVLAVSHEDTLNEETKQSYYTQYVQIAEEISKQSGIDIVVNPMEEFAEEDWKTPEDFRELIEKIANWDIRCNTSNTPEVYSSASKTKTASLEADGKTFEIAVTGTFTTQYNPNTERQHFWRVDSITSEISSGSAAWTQTGYDYKWLDAVRTAGINVSGTLKVAQATFRNKLAYIEFYCSDKGKIS